MFQHIGPHIRRSPVCRPDLERLHPSKINQGSTAPKDRVSTVKEILMKWTDTQRIAEELYDLHGDSIDPKTVRFTQLRDLIMALPDFDDAPARCGERILEAVQQAWIEETE